MDVNHVNWQYGLSTHTGPVKKTNEDQAFLRIAADPIGDEIAIAIVADGMGGYKKGDVASQLAVEMMKDWWDRRIQKLLKQRRPMLKISQELEQLLYEINRALLEMKQREGIKAGTTLSFLLLYRGKYIIGHVGDSRIYHLTNGFETTQAYIHKQKQKTSPDEDTDVLVEDTTEILDNKRLYQLTEDHSWVQMQVNMGNLTKEQARNHTKRNVLMQCLGVEQDIDPFQTVGFYNSNDLFLLCSDGFYTSFSDEDIKNELHQYEQEWTDLQSVSNELVQMAYRAGAKDNITVVLLRHLFTEGGESIGYGENQPTNR